MNLRKTKAKARENKEVFIWQLPDADRGFKVDGTAYLPQDLARRQAAVIPAIDPSKKSFQPTPNTFISECTGNLVMGNLEREDDIEVLFQDDSDEAVSKRLLTLLKNKAEAEKLIMYYSKDLASITSQIDELTKAHADKE